MLFNWSHNGDLSRSTLNYSEGTILTELHHDKENYKCYCPKLKEDCYNEYCKNFLNNYQTLQQQTETFDCRWDFDTCLENTKRFKSQQTEQVKLNVDELSSQEKPHVKIKVPDDGACLFRAALFDKHKILDV